MTASCPNTDINADGMVVCHLPFGPTAYFGLHNTVLRHDIGQKREVSECGKSDKCGQRV
jgi:rRNA maturation protein Rpf1